MNTKPIFFFADFCESFEPKQKHEYSRKKLTLLERDKNNSNDNEDTTEDTKLLNLSTCPKEMVTEDTEDEERRILLPSSTVNTLPNSKRNTSVLQYVSEKKCGKNESYECIRTDVAVVDDECYAILKIMDNIKNQSNEKLMRPRITFLDFAGHGLYYAFHQIYLSPKTCYILVVDMTKSPDEQVSETDVDKIDGRRFTSWKYKGKELVI